MAEPINMRLNPPANKAVVANLNLHLHIKLPEEYLDFLLKHNGGDGTIGENRLVLWKAEELERFNKEYEVEKYAPGIFLIGSSGGGEGYGFDTTTVPMPIVSIPFIGMERRLAERIANSFLELFSDDMTEQVRGGQTDVELVEIKPIIVGGSSVDLENKMLLTRPQHFEFVRYWNRVVSELRHQPH